VDKPSSMTGSRPKRCKIRISTYPRQKYCWTRPASSRATILWLLGRLILVNSQLKSQKNCLGGCCQSRYSLGVTGDRQGQGLGRSLLAQALRDCYDASQTFAFVAVILDCIDDDAKSFYMQFDFSELPGHPYRLFLGFRQLEAMMTAE
jgi:GNAT superfamily N-acetyltransferase